MDFVIRLFPLWAIALSLLAYFSPAPFAELKPAIVPLLTVIMFSMGLTLSIDDFKRALSMPRLIITGLFLQYSIMPLAALAIATMLQLDPALTIGMILVGASPGGTASNVITYLARGNVALSISLTSISTIIAIVLTPAITLLIADTSIQVPAGKMFISILYIVIFPVALGLALKHFFAYRIKTVEHYLPLVAVAAIVLIIAIITALNVKQFSQLGITVLLAVILHNVAGLLTGYASARLMSYPEKECRTLAIEVGMQNSGLAVALAIKHFTAAAALPGAIFSIWHNISGSALALFWSNKRD
ncbi:MAG: bile acid:sodium symporter family protein [Gammaproteobacteria bacterium]|nr:bile acid:sodium symporter family protein [Gammaproteobacteria bacterium]NNJ49101.1 bile acid:sodium symporter family protein [Gammaproteobacteria bacterium]